jgi:hypothetical protein
MAAYNEMLTRWGSDPAAGIAVVHGRLGMGVGLSDTLAAMYVGEAGPSERLRVYWACGDLTMPCCRGMEARSEDSRCPGGYREWWIR